MVCCSSPDRVFAWQATEPASSLQPQPGQLPMALIVQKFGGSSVADIDRIRNVANRVAEYRRRGDQVVVVVSR
ncbi:MAG: hypothetical protein Ct9H300mP32_2680 [Verrucomicrobiota bacterium]|nr:MAG: hypothetical protein Ct9H300mP32_2680 [Verrucomicrobiota bacterium]